MGEHFGLGQSTSARRTNRRRSLGAVRESLPALNGAKVEKLEQAGKDARTRRLASRKLRHDPVDGGRARIVGSEIDRPLTSARLLLLSGKRQHLPGPFLVAEASVDLRVVISGPDGDFA